MSVSPRAPDVRETVEAVEAPLTRSVALIVIATILVFGALHVARALFIPLICAALLSLALSPPIRFLARYHVPPPAGALLILGVSAARWSKAVRVASKERPVVSRCSPDEVSDPGRSRHAEGVTLVSEIAGGLSCLGQLGLPDDVGATSAWGTVNFGCVAFGIAALRRGPGERRAGN